VTLALVDLVQNEEGAADHGDQRGEESEGQEEFELKTGAESAKAPGKRQAVHS
jgi:hypothetical protein